MDHYALRYVPTGDGFRPTGFRGSFGWTVSSDVLAVAEALTSVLAGGPSGVHVAEVARDQVTFTVQYVPKNATTPQELAVVRARLDTTK